MLLVVPCTLAHVILLDEEGPGVLDVDEVEPCARVGGVAQEHAGECQAATERHILQCDVGDGYSEWGGEEGGALPPQRRGDKAGAQPCLG